MARQLHTRNRKSVIERLNNLVKASGSPQEAVSKLTEEALVRIYDNRTARSVITGFITPREPEKWLFLVGCYNSGTTLLQKVLQAHPQIGGLPREGVRFTEALSNLELNDHHMIWDDDWRDHAFAS